MTAIAPRWYLRTETPVGTRYFYPLPQSKAGGSWARVGGIGWVDDEGNPLTVSGMALVSDRPVRIAVEGWTTQPSTTGWELLEPVDVPAHLRGAVELGAYRQSLTPQEFEVMARDDEARDMLTTIYRRTVSDPIEHAQGHDLTGLVEMPGDPDPAPPIPWNLDQPLTGGFYGPLVAHLFPGWLDPAWLHERVGELAREQFRELGLIASGIGDGVHVWTHNAEVAVSAAIPWDEPLPYQVMRGSGAKAREINGKRHRDAVIGTTWHHTEKINQPVHGATKAEALANLERKAREITVRLMPPHTEACSRCHGRGYTK